MRQQTVLCVRGPRLATGGLLDESHVYLATESALVVEGNAAGSLGWLSRGM